jgi:hypothetical protein
MFMKTGGHKDCRKALGSRGLFLRAGFWGFYRLLQGN